MLKGSKEWRAEDVECRGSISARVSSDEGKEKKKGTKEKREGERQSARAKKKGVRTSDDFFGKHEFAGRLMKKKRKKKGRTITSRRVIR